MLCDLINANVDVDELDDVLYNTKMFKSILGRYEEEKNEVYSCESA